MNTRPPSTIEEEIERSTSLEEMALLYTEFLTGLDQGQYTHENLRVIFGLIDRRLMDLLPNLLPEWANDSPNGAILEYFVCHQGTEIKQDVPSAMTSFPSPQAR